MILFDVPGLPKTAGSKKAFVVKKKGRLGVGREDFTSVVTDDCTASDDWKTHVAIVARQAYQGPLLDGCLEVTMEFRFPRPTAHYGRQRGVRVVKASAPYQHNKKPDLLKLARAVEDALSGVIYVDDARISDEILRKRYDANPGVTVTISFVGINPTRSTTASAAAP